MAATYRAEHIGSLLRPPEVLQARGAHGQGQIGLEQLREVEDKAILDALEMQRQAGIDILKDGEFRRSWFSGEIAEAVEGVINDPNAVYTSRWQGENQLLADATAEGIGFGGQAPPSPASNRPRVWFFETIRLRSFQDHNARCRAKGGWLVQTRADRQFLRQPGRAGSGPGGDFAAGDKSPAGRGRFLYPA